MGYGWRGRIGLLVPSSNTTLESEFWRMVPAGVSVHTARMRLLSNTVEENINMEKYAMESAIDLSTAKVNVIAYGCTSGSFVGGQQWEADLTQKLTSTTGLPVITASMAVVNALKSLKVTRISVVTPYPEDINQREKAFFEGAGFDIVKIGGLSFRDNVEVGLQEPSATFKIAKDSFEIDAEALFISCTNLRTIDIIDVLEKDFGKPVVTSAQALMWAVLHKLKVSDQITHYGTLLREHLAR